MATTNFWDSVEPGTRFTAEIKGVKTSGKIQKERGNIYLCQNILEGSTPTDTFGYKYGWYIQTGNTDEEFYIFNILNLKVGGKEHGPQGIYLNRRNIIIRNGKATINGYKIPFKTVDNIYNRLMNGDTRKTYKYNSIGDWYCRLDYGVTRVGCNYFTQDQVEQLWTLMIAEGCK